MAEYRFYCVTVNGVAGRGDFIEADSDQDAINLVKKRHPNSDCELWDDDRLVATIKRDEH